MIPRLTAALSSRFRSSLSFSFFSTTAASISPSPAELRKMTVKQLVEDAISDNKVVIFSKSWCPYCKRVKSLFANAYPTEKPVVLELDERDDGSDIQSYLAERTGQRTVPSVFVNKEHLGGNDDTQAAFKSGKLAKLLNSKS